MRHTLLTHEEASEVDAMLLELLSRIPEPLSVEEDARLTKVRNLLMPEEERELECSHESPMGLPEDLK